MNIMIKQVNDLRLDFYSTYFILKYPPPKIYDSKFILYNNLIVLVTKVTQSFPFYEA